MYILICQVIFLCPPKDFAQATALRSLSKNTKHSSPIGQHS